MATNDCHYLLQSDAKAHEALLCIQTQTTLHDKGRMSFETDQLYLKSPQEMEEYFHWIPQALDATIEVAARCRLELPKGRYHFPVYPTEKGTTLEELIDQKAWSGLKARMEGEIPDEYAKRLEEELGIIRSMGFAGYFLIVADYIQYAKANGIPVGPGRGSAAGSLSRTLWASPTSTPSAGTSCSSGFSTPSARACPISMWTSARAGGMR